MSQLNDLKKETEVRLEGMVKMYEGEAVISEMIQVHQNLKDKRTVIFWLILDF
jgi:hypothetical protein